MEGNPRHIATSTMVIVPYGPVIGFKPTSCVEVRFREWIRVAN